MPEARASTAGLVALGVVMACHPVLPVPGWGRPVMPPPPTVPVSSTMGMQSMGVPVVVAHPVRMVPGVMVGVSMAAWAGPVPVGPGRVGVVVRSSVPVAAQ
jgi:hypothetical protein